MSVIAFKTAGDVPGADMRLSEALQPSRRIDVAFERVMEFSTDRVDGLCLDRATLQRCVEEEAAFGRVVVDDRALTAGNRLHTIHPARACFADWRKARKAFETALEPKRADIEAVEKLDADVATLRNCARDELVQVVEGWRLRETNKAIESDWNDAQARYAAAKARNGGRSPNMAAQSPIYWIAMLLIGLADWLINYHTFFAFTGVPAIAVGATANIGILLALGSHGHGAVLKQWSHRFGPEAQRGRMGLRLLILATLAVAVVLCAMAGTRYAVAMRAVAPQGLPNILGPAVLGDVSPVRDVLLTLLGNIGAWIVGMFVSSSCHDIDPDFVEATHQFRREGRRYRHARRHVARQIEELEERCSREVVHLQIETLSKAAAVAQERGQLAQVIARENALIEALVTAVQANAQEYRDLLAQYIMSRRGAVQVFLGCDDEHRELSPYDFMALGIRIDAELITAVGA